MATPPQTMKEVSLKLLVNKETDKVLFAEAGKDFVDALFSFLTLPLGTIVRLIEKPSNTGPVMVGCLNSLYHSVEDLDTEYLCISKEMLLQPINSSEDYCNTLELNIDDSQPTKYCLCGCGSVRLRWCTSIFENCQCGSLFFSQSVLLKHYSKGFVNSFSTFLITDELIVMPTSMEYTSLGLLQNSGIKSTNSVKEVIVNVTKEKVLDLLKCALSSDQSTLTDLFLEKNKPFLGSINFLPCDVENTSNIQIKVKLFIWKTFDKILFALGEQDFADLILSFLTFPLGGIVHKLGGKCFLGCIDELYKSIADLDEKKYFSSTEAKNRLMDPHLAHQFKSMKHILPIQEPRLFNCYYQYDNMFRLGIIHNDRSCGSRCESVRLVDPKSSTVRNEGFVKGPRTYTVTDDLFFAPTVSVLDLLDRLGTPLNDVEEKSVTIGLKECLNILQASLISTSALTMGLSHLLH